MNSLIDFIKKIQTEKKIQSLNEEATKQSIILPILQLIGWQVFDADEVSPEFSIENKRVDYALRNGSINKVFIEVKRINEDLEKHQEQLLTYSFRQGVNLSILTNGILWWFYLPLQEGSWEQRKFYAIDMYSQSFAKIADILVKFLAKEKVFNGKALQNAKKLYGNRQKKDIIKRNIPKAWRKLHIEGDDLFIELLAETTENICGHRPENIEVSEFLFSIVNQEHPRSNHTKEKTKKEKLIIKRTPKKVQVQNEDLYSLNDNFTYKKITDFVFLSETIPAKSWKELLMKFIEKIHIKHKNDFEKITSVTGRKRPYSLCAKMTLDIF
ncbi:MAG: restriction endonuclease subunit R [Candidatus Cloacimonetes bacterium]|nr:restriction endonuclease subunit R [Candidatus Cloacimonadota bacterium]